MKDLTFKPKISQQSEKLERNRLIRQRDQVKSMFSPGENNQSMAVPFEGSFNVQQIEKMDESSINRDLKPSVKERFQQLYQGGFQKKIRQKQAVKEKQESELKDCTFRPVLVTDHEITNKMRLKREQAHMKELNKLKKQL